MSREAFDRAAPEEQPSAIGPPSAVPGQREARRTIVHLVGEADQRRELLADARSGLTATPKVLAPKYFYDARGSELFERITRLPEYYLPRAETLVLEALAEPLLESLRPAEIVEIGSGSSRKTRLLLEAMRQHGGGHRYSALDVSEAALDGAASALCQSYPWLEFRGFVGDFLRHLGAVPRCGRRLVAFLGSTIGNLHPRQRVGFLRSVAAMLEPADRFVLGVDRVKDRVTLEAAYNDAAGVTSEFNRNALRVLNAQLDADFPVEQFEHVAFYDEANAWIEMRLRARAALDVRIPALELQVHFDRGEELQTEISCKFTRDVLERAFGEAGLRLEGWHSDPDELFSVAVARLAR